MFRLAAECESLDEGDRAGIGCGALQAGLLEQKPRDDAVDDPQHRCEQLGPCGKEDAKPDRKGQHPLPDRHLGHHLLDQERSALGHAPRAARGAKPAPLAGERYPLLVCAVNAAHAQKSVRQNAALEKGLELVPDERGQARAGPGLDLGEEGLQMLPHQPMQERLLGPPPLVADRVRRCGAQRWFALQSHPDANARTTTAGHRDLAGAEKSPLQSTSGTASALSKIVPIQSAAGFPARFRQAVAVRM